MGGWICDARWRELAYWEIKDLHEVYALRMGNKLEHGFVAVKVAEGGYP